MRSSKPPVRPNAHKPAHGKPAPGKPTHGKPAPPHGGKPTSKPRPDSRPNRAHTAGGPAPAGALPTLVVSRATARFIVAGHPWVRPDRFTKGLEKLKAGDAVTLVDQDGNRIASALADPQHALCARVYHRKPDMAFMPAEALARAWDRRAALHADPETDCYRIVNGEADFLPALRVERYGQAFVVLVLAGCAERAVDAVCRGIAERAPGATIVIREHTDDLRREDVRSVRHGGGALDPEQVVEARELGVRYPLRPFAGLATGLYIDQRPTRAWLRPQANGKSLLNLFAYTGAFSVSLLAAGGARAIDVDLAGPALERAEEAAALNGVSDRHSTVKADCRRYLTASQESFDIIICDPPTAAQGGDGWVLRRDYPEVLRLAFLRLAPNGLLLACCNTINGKAFPLAEVVREAAASAKVIVQDVAVPALGDDVPQIAGFPEGRPYRLVAVRRLR